jgi:type IV pilus assembly protein PilW
VIPARPLPATGARPARAAGATLVELMVSMTIGLFLTAGAIYVFVQSKDSYRSADSLARLQESARFALDTIEPDIRLTWFYGQDTEPGRLSVPPGIGVACDGADVGAWALDIGTSIAATDDTYDLPCPARWDTPREGSDVLVVRHANPDPAVPTAGQVQVLARLGGGELVADGSAAPVAPDSLHDLEVRAYYVNERSSFDARQPSLRQLTLTRNAGAPVIIDEEVIAGVENLQVQFGLDTSGDGNVDRYVEPDLLGASPAATIVAVRLWLLVGTPADEPAFRDARSYRLPDGVTVINAGSDGYPDNVRRLAVSKTIFLRNRRS